MPYGLSGIKVDEDYKRYYPLDTWRPRCSALRVRITREFWGLKSNTIPICRERAGKILTLTDARGIEIENAGETRLEPVNGYDLIYFHGQQYPAIL